MTDASSSTFCKTHTELPNVKVKLKDFGLWHWKLFINSTFLQNVPICKLIQQPQSFCHIHPPHNPVPAGSKEWLHAGWADLAQSPSLDVRLSCLNHLSQSNPGPGLPVSPLTPLSSLGPLKEGGSSSDRTTLAAPRPEPDTFLKVEPGCS